MHMQIIVMILLYLPSVLSQFCSRIPQPARLSHLHSLFTSGGKVNICSGFVISLEGCDTNEQPFTVSQYDLTIACDDFFGGGGKCEISCPGRHFVIEGGRTLVLEGMTLKGATSGSIEIMTSGNLIGFDSTWERYALFIMFFCIEVLSFH